VITKRDGVYSCSCGGIAYVGVFNYAGGSHPPDFYKPALVFYDMLGSGNEKAVAEAISHEAGHNMGLHHDGTSSDAYYAGQGDDAITGWAPIMGVGYYRPLVQFSKGEYNDANNKEDDFVVAQDFGLPLRLDDYGSDIRTATPFVQTVANGAVSGSMDGVIETASDKDVFAIAAGAGTLTANVMPANRSPDVDVLLNLLDAKGNVLASVNPLNALNATLTYNVTAQGTYYLRVEGTGQRDAATTGYSDYGSVGNFRLSASFAAPAGTPPTAVIAASTTNGPSPLSVTLDGRGSRDDGRVAFWYWDFGDGSNDVTGTLSAPDHVYQVAGSYLARLTVVDDTGLSASTTQMINVTAPQPLASVQSILITTKTNSRSYAWAVASVTVVDQFGRPLRNAKVSADWNGVASKSVLVNTNKFGKATLTSPKTLASGCFNLFINDVTAPSYPFNGASQRSAQICR
jgi:PKD repeat protein